MKHILLTSWDIQQVWISMGSHILLDSSIDSGLGSVGILKINTADTGTCTPKCTRPGDSKIVFVSVLWHIRVHAT